MVCFRPKGLILILFAFHVSFQDGRREFNVRSMGKDGSIYLPSSDGSEAGPKLRIPKSQNSCGPNKLGI
jgi:hypothetical protein